MDIAPVSVPTNTGGVIAPDGPLAKRLKALPPSARAKFEKLRRAEIKARAAVDGLTAQIERVREARDDAERDLHIFDRHNRHPQFTYEEDAETKARRRIEVQAPERVALVEAFEAHKAELRRLTEEMAAIPRTDTAPIAAWLLSQDAKLVAVEVKLGKNDTLERNAAEQRHVSDELAAVGNAPRTIAEAKAAMRQEIARLAEKGRPEVGGLFHDQPIEWPTETFQAGGFGAHQYVVAATIKDAFALTIWANHDAIISALDKEIERQGDDTGAISAEDQSARVAALEAQLLTLQREAEAIIDRLEVPVKRACLLPEVLLGVERAKQ